MRLACTTLVLGLSALLSSLLSSLLPSLATAGPMTIGAGMGRTQNKIHANNDPSSTVQLFGRLGLTRRLGVQLELQKIDDRGMPVRSGTALGVLDLGGKSRWVPLVLAGVGIDKAGEDDAVTNARHIEAGVGLEYRFDGGLTLGADVRIGGRSVDQPKDVIIAAETDAMAIFPGPGPSEGEYRSGRVTAAVRF